jgi:hypothetical protein
MKIGFRLIPVAVIAAILISPIVARGGSQSHPLGEDAALDLLQRTLKRDRVYEKRISLDCIAYGTEETTNAYFGFVLREIHNANAVASPKQVTLLTVTASIDVPAKSSSGKQPQTNGSRIGRPQTKLRAYANRARRSERDRDFPQMGTATTAVVLSKMFRLLPFRSCAYYTLL